MTGQSFARPIYSNGFDEQIMIVKKSNLPIYLVQMAFGVVALMIIALLFFTQKAYTELNYLGEEQVRIVRLSENIEYFDEVLTMSARLAISKKDLSWEERYLKNVPFLDKAIEETLGSLNVEQREQFVEKTKLANSSLIDMEIRAFSLAREHKWLSAEKILYSEEYARFKAQYANGLQELSVMLNQKLRAHQETEESLLRYDMYILIALLVFVVVIGAFVAWILNRWNKSEQLAYQKMAETNMELEEFAYRTSHDLRSPIVSSIRLLDMTESSVKENEVEKALFSLAHAKNSLQKLEVLIKDILLLTEAKNKVEESTDFKMSVLVKAALEKMQHMDKFENLEIQTEFQYQGVVHAKESRVNMILENLLSNAIKYQNPEESSPYIKISTLQRHGEFVLEIADNGLGIPDDQHENLFAMFKRFHPKVAFGSGLGLYLMKKSADVLNGEISFRSNGGGSVFTLSIPQ